VALFAAVATSQNAVAGAKFLLDITEATVKVHRSNVMRKMRIASTAEFYRNRIQTQVGP
jgi:FixJ family two-component response regulator